VPQLLQHCDFVVGQISTSSRGQKSLYSNTSCAVTCNKKGGKYTYFQGNPCQTAKQIVIAGLKCPPEVAAQVIIANAMPIAYAHPIWNIDANAGSVLFRKNDA